MRRIREKMDLTNPYEDTTDVEVMESVRLALGISNPSARRFCISDNLLYRYKYSMSASDEYEPPPVLQNLQQSPSIGSAVKSPQDGLLSTTASSGVSSVFQQQPECMTCPLE